MQPFKVIIELIRAGPFHLFFFWGGGGGLDNLKKKSCIAKEEKKSIAQLARGQKLSKPFYSQEPVGPNEKTICNFRHNLISWFCIDLQIKNTIIQVFMGFCSCLFPSNQFLYYQVHQ